MACAGPLVLLWHARYAAAPSVPSARAADTHRHVCTALSVRARQRLYRLSMPATFTARFVLPCVCVYHPVCAVSLCRRVYRHVCTALSVRLPPRLCRPSVQTTVTATFVPPCLCVYHPVCAARPRRRVCAVSPHRLAMRVSRRLPASGSPLTPGAPGFWPQP
eukprot:361349-Chlamydomonas_euryale.AAC.1